MLSSTGKRSAVVFGGAGFIGTHLLDSLFSSGLYKRLVSYDLTTPRRYVDQVEYVLGDVRKPIELPRDIEEFEIYNLAAVHTTPGHEDWEYYWTNILGAQNVTRFAHDRGCNFILFTSSISVYGPSERGVNEDTPPRPQSAYGRSKLIAETIHHHWFAEGLERRLVVVRPAVIFGPGEGGNFTRLAGLLKRGRFAYPGRRNTIKSCGYVEELVRSMTFARDFSHGAFVYNFAYPERLTTESICRAFADVADFAMPVWVVPLPLMMAIGLAFEVLGTVGVKTSINRARINKLVHSTNIVPRALSEAGYVFETDFRAALTRWRETSNGLFV